jgi:hypothetical protein
MFLKVGGKIITQGEKFMEKSFNYLEFTVNGDRFPLDGSGRGGPRFVLVFSRTTSIEINWDDGNVQTYEGDSISFSEASPYLYQDSNTEDRTIRITFEEPDSLLGINSLRTFLGRVFPVNITKFLSITNISLNQGSGIEVFPESLASLINLKNLVLSEASLTQLPLSVLNLGLESLAVNRSIDLSLPNSNFERINLLQNTLLVLSIGGTNISTFPSTFLELSNLEVLSIADIPYSGSIPSQVFGLEKLKLLTWDITDGKHLNDLQGLQFMENLESLDINCRFFGDETVFDPVIPDIQNLKKINEIIITGGTRCPLNVQSKMDEFVNSIYSNVNSYASKTLGNTAFRQMTIITNSSTPSGLYQEPSGFVLGSDNGNPQTPLEKIWIMVNQYEHTWNYSQ